MLYTQIGCICKCYDENRFEHCMKTICNSAKNFCFQYEISESFFVSKAEKVVMEEDVK